MRLGVSAALVALAVACQGPEGVPEGVPEVPERHSQALPRAQALAVEGWQERLPMFPRYEGGETVLRWMTGPGDFAIHYSVGGRNGIPPGDFDGDGIPDWVEEVGLALDGALKFYREELGLPPPLASLEGPAGPLDVFLLDFAGRGDGQFLDENCRPAPSRVCQGMLLVENDFAGYRYGSPVAALRTVGSHELFHAIQAALGAEDHGVLWEGTATWATEAFDPSLTDFERALPGYLDATDQPLSVPPSGPSSPFSYGAGLFFRFLSERLGNAIVPALLERSAAARPASATPRWMAALAELLQERHATTFAAVFADFALANVRTGVRAGAGGYQEASRYPQMAVEKRTLPLTQTGLRVFPASARTYSVPIGGRPRLRAAVTSAQGEGPLELAVLARRAGAWSVAGRDPREVTIDGPFEPDSELIVVLSNGALAGASTRVSLCVGDDSEIETCRAATPPPAVPPGAAEPEAGGCTLAAGRATPRPSGLVALLGLLAIAARRRRR